MPGIPLFNALIWAACCAGAEAAAIRFELCPRRPLSRRQTGGLLAAAAVMGALGGWLAAPRTAEPLDQLRLLLAMAALCAAAGADLLLRKIPNRISLGLLGGFVLCTALDFLLRREQAAGLLLSGILGGAGLLAALGLCRLVSRGGIGLGDIKLFSSLSLVLGLYGGMSTLVLSQLAALLCAAALLISRRATLKDSIPFAPFFALGFLFCLFLGTY